MFCKDFYILIFKCILDKNKNKTYNSPYLIECSDKGGFGGGGGGVIPMLTNKIITKNY